MKKSQGCSKSVSHQQLRKEVKKGIKEVKAWDIKQDKALLAKKKNTRKTK